MILRKRMMWIAATLILTAGGLRMSGTFSAEAEGDGGPAAEISLQKAVIPRSYGALKQVKYMYPDRKHNIAELWFVDTQGTIRIVTVDKGKEPGDEVVVSPEVRVISRRE